MVPSSPANNEVKLNPVDAPAILQLLVLLFHGELGFFQSPGLVVLGNYSLPIEVPSGCTPESKKCSLAQNTPTHKVVQSYLCSYVWSTYRATTGVLKPGLKSAVVAGWILCYASCSYLAQPNGLRGGWAEGL